MSTIAAVGTMTSSSRLDNLRASFGKFRRGEALSPEDRLFLRENSRSPFLARIFSCFPPHPADRRAKEINHIALEILASKELSKPLLNQVDMLFSRENPETPQLIASLSNLLTICLEVRGDFSVKIANFRREQKRAPTRLDLIVLASRYNEIPDLSKAGTEATPIGDITLKYDEKGFLRIEQGCLTPIDLECSQRLTREQVEEMKRLYVAMTNQISYNNLGEMLEFNHYYKKEKATDPSLTLAKAIASYKPDLPGIFTKYHFGGTCLLLSVSFRAELAKIGIRAESMGERGINRWSALPLPNCPNVIWNAFSRAVCHAPHTRTSCFYQDEEGVKRVIIFEGSFEVAKPKEVEESKLEQFLEAYSTLCEVDPSRWACSQIPFQVPDAIADPSVIYKGRLQGRFKAVMESITDRKKILGVDFLRGNFYINPSWSRTLTGLPLNEKGMASILLTDLARPDEGGTYFVDGEEKEMTHREALRMILEKIKGELYFPEDFEENMISLAENTDSLFTDFFLDPMQTIRHLYEDFSTVSRKISEEQDDLTTPEEIAAFQPTLDKFNALIEDVKGNREADAREKLDALLADPALFSTEEGAV